tara:strand:+ start:740 stop:907 length:168 start_codon:yes stop_codon:yes gene_type:complete
MKLIVCESCEAEFKISHNLNEMYYVVKHCTFCGVDLAEDELQDEVELEGYDNEDE